MATIQEQNMQDYQTLQFDYLAEAEQMFGPKTEYEYSVHKPLYFDPVPPKLNLMQIINSLPVATLAKRGQLEWFFQ